MRRLVRAGSKQISSEIDRNDIVDLGRVLKGFGVDVARVCALNSQGRELLPQINNFTQVQRSEILAQR